MNYHDISKENMANGDGLRAVLFVSGCTHHCKGCQNPQTWDKNSGILFDNVAKEELFAELQKKHIDGVTFSGGDPLAPFNRYEILDLIDEIRYNFPNKTIWVYSGYRLETLKAEDPEFTRRLLSLIDVLVDGPFNENQRQIDLENGMDPDWRGDSSQRVLRAINWFEPDEEASFVYDENLDGCAYDTCACV